MKKVLIFSTAYYPYVGGAEVAVKEITDRIKDIEFDMITALIDKKLKRKEKIGNINVYRYGFGFKTLDKFLLPFFGFYFSFKKNKYKVIWSIMASHASVSASIYKLINRKTKLLLTLQEGDEETYLERYVCGIKILYKIFIKPWHLLVFKKADYITVISSYLKKRAKKNKANCKIEIIPNAVEVDNFFQKYSEDELNNLKLKLNKSQEDKYLITTSRLVLKNAVDDIIKSLKYLPDNIKFLILGSGSDEVKLKELVNKENVKNRVKFLGLVDQKEIPKYLKISDIFIRPSLSEGFGNSFVEAMAIGIPVIATPVGGIVDFLFDPEKNKDKKPTGFFCNVRDPKSIAVQVEKIINNKELSNKIVNNARDMVIEKYDWNIIAKKMDSIFKKI